MSVETDDLKKYELPKSMFVLALSTSPGFSLVSLTHQVSGRYSRLQPARVRKKIRNIERSRVVRPRPDHLIPKRRRGIQETRVEIPEVT